MRRRFLHEGKPIGTPDPGGFWRLMSEYGVKVLFSAPTALRAILKADPDGSYINVAGHRLSTGQIEAVLAAQPAVAECAVIGVADEIKGPVPRGLVVLKAGARGDGLEGELIAAVRHSIGAVACLGVVDIVAALPKTCSGKILRKTMRGIADGRDEPMPSNIEDPAVLDALRPILLGR